MEIEFRRAIADDAECIAQFVIKLTNEICELTNAQHFDIDLNQTVQRCRQLLTDGHYVGIIGIYNDTPIAVVTMAETYALYAGGKIGVIQEFYVEPEYRATGIGTMLVDHIKIHGLACDWACIELCTPPLPAFERTLNFYQKNGLVPVGGRKMRQTLDQ